MAAPPNAFSGHLEKWILDETKHSIFFINLWPIETRHAEIRQLVEKAGHVPEDQIDALFGGDGHSATGFVVEEGPVHLKILTCAHVIKHVFSASQPLSAYDADRLFSTWVSCDHNEVSFRQAGNMDNARVYTQGNIIGISCADDLMLIRVGRVDLRDLDQNCMQPHPALRFSLTPPVAFDDCVMISWPPFRHRTCVKGQVSHVSRSFNDLRRANPLGFRINLMEVKIVCQQGSSGAPLLNGIGRVIGLLHGRSRFSFFVPLNDIITFLANQGVPL